MKLAFFCCRFPSFLIDLPLVKPRFGTTAVTETFFFVPLLFAICLRLPLLDQRPILSRRDWLAGIRQQAGRKETC